MSEHTPGPWKVEIVTKPFYCRDTGKKLSDDVSVWIRPINGREHDYIAVINPNLEMEARLIAAAPELAEALRRAHVEIINLLNEGDFRRYITLDLHYIVDALGKAEGVSHE